MKTLTCGECGEGYTSKIDRPGRDRVYRCKSCRRKISSRKYKASEKGIASERRYRQSEKGKETQRRYENSEKYRRTTRMRSRIRRAEDLNFKIKGNLRTRLYWAVKFNRGVSAVRDLGCSIEEFKLYLESIFDENMNWDNYGIYWELDHIIPLSFFDLTDGEQAGKACHYTNIQPMLVSKNRSKGNRI